jgi:hypothetical protein
MKQNPLNVGDDVCLSGVNIISLRHSDSTGEERIVLSYYRVFVRRRCRLPVSISLCSRSTPIIRREERVLNRVDLPRIINMNIINIIP